MGDNLRPVIRELLARKPRVQDYSAIDRSVIQEWHIAHAAEAEANFVIPEFVTCRNPTASYGPSGRAVLALIDYILALPDDDVNRLLAVHLRTGPVDDAVGVQPTLIAVDLEPVVEKMRGPAGQHAGAYAAAAALMRVGAIAEFPGGFRVWLDMSSRAWYAGEAASIAHLVDSQVTRDEWTTLTSPWVEALGPYAGLQQPW